MSSMGALYAPLAWFNKALINYIQAQRALFGNMVLDAMGANNFNVIPCTYSEVSLYGIMTTVVIMVQVCL